MHGILFKYLNAYVEEEYGEDAWEAAMDAAGIEPKLYLPVTEYPDEEAQRLLDGVTEVTGTDEADLLPAYGERLAPELLDTFEAHLMDDWDLFDLLEHTDNQVFTVLYSEDGGADEVTAAREDGEVVLRYDSPLEMCGLVEGVLRGLSAAHGADATVREDACVQEGAERCEFRVARA